MNNRIYAIVGIILLYVLAWNFTFKKTGQKYQELKSLKNKKQLLETSFSKYSVAENTIESMESTYNLFFKNDYSNEYIFNKVLTYCNTLDNVQVVSAPEVHESTTENILISTNIIELKGDYFELVEVLKTIENSNQFGILTNLIFYNKTNFSTNREELYLKLSLQVFKEINSTTKNQTK